MYKRQGDPRGLADVPESATRRYLFPEHATAPAARAPRTPRGWLALEGVTRNNLRGLDVSFPAGCLTAVTGISGSGKSSLVSQARPVLGRGRLGQRTGESQEITGDPESDLLTADDAAEDVRGKVTSVPEGVRRVVVILSLIHI